MIDAEDEVNEEEDGSVRVHRIAEQEEDGNTVGKEVC